MQDLSIDEELLSIMQTQLTERSVLQDRMKVLTLPLWDPRNPNECEIWYSKQDKEFTTNFQFAAAKSKSKPRQTPGADRRALCRP